MTVKERDRALALAALITEDFAIGMNLTRDALPAEFKDLAEAVGMFCYATGDLERAAATGALVYTAARVP